MAAASASTASSTVVRMATSALSSRPESSTVIGTNESNPNSMSGALLISRFRPADRSSVPRLGSLIPFAITNTSGPDLLHMQVPAKQDLAAHLDRLIDEAVPGRRGLEAGGALLESHATLMLPLQTYLLNKTSLYFHASDCTSHSPPA